MNEQGGRDENFNRGNEESTEAGAGGGENYCRFAAVAEVRLPVKTDQRRLLQLVGQVRPDRAGQHLFFLPGRERCERPKKQGGDLKGGGLRV